MKLPSRKRQEIIREIFCCHQQSCLNNSFIKIQIFRYNSINMKYLTITLLAYALFSGCQCYTTDERFGVRLSEYTYGSIPRLQTEFQAMLFPLFQIGDWQTAYELTLQGTYQRADYLITANYLDINLCTIIELKRSGSVDDAVEQAIGYGRWFEQNGVCGNNWCAVGINIPRTFPQKTIQVKFERNNLLGCAHYQGPFRQTIQYNRVIFTDILDFVRGNNDL